MYMYLEDFRFADIADFRKANFFLGKSDLLFALAVDYPGFQKLPLAYVAAAKAELKRLGWLVERGDLNRKVFTYRVFYLGPRVKRAGYGRPCSTRPQDATGFKIYFYGFPDGDSVMKGGK